MFYLYLFTYYYVPIEKLYMNKSVRMSTADRLIELAVRNGLTLGIPAFKEAAEAIKETLITEPTDEPNFETVKRLGVMQKLMQSDFVQTHPYTPFL